MNDFREEGGETDPRRLTDASQAWFWTPGWQKGEREASDDITAGRTTVYETGEDLLQSLKRP